jgi:hypothetical protein
VSDFGLLRRYRTRRPRQQNRYQCHSISRFHRLLLF